MSLINDGYRSAWLKKLDLKDREKLSFTYNYLLHNKLITYPVGSVFPDYAQMVLSVENLFNQHYPDEKSRLAEANHIDELYSSSRIPQELLDWIDEKNQRQCYYLWCLIRLISGLDREIKHPEDLLNIYNAEIKMLTRRDYDYLCLSKMPSNSVQCKENIVKFISRWHPNQIFKSEFIDCLKSHWNKKNEFKHRLFKHLKHDHIEHGKWFWEYLVDNAKVPHWFLSPITDTEYFGCAFAILDVWQTGVAEKTLMLNKAYSNFYNNGPKLKPNNERGANIWLNADYLNQLNEIARKKGYTTKLALKRLISAEFDKLSK